MPEKYPSPEDWATGRRLAAETRIIATTRRRSATNAARLDAWMFPRSDGLQAHGGHMARLITGGGESGTQVVRVRDRARRVALLIAALLVFAAP
jgi:hypothetical protein